MRLARVIFAACVLACAAAADAQTDDEAGSKLPVQTSRYNVGNQPGRYRDANRKIRLFALKRGQATLYDGAARQIGKLTKPAMLNIGAAKQMDVGDGRGKQSYAWAWATEAGSGWVARSDLVNPPPPEVDPKRNPKPPHESKDALTINAAAGRAKLEGLRHPNSQGVIPPSGNRGTDYAGRHPGEADYVYLLFACPNVVRGGVARDSLADGAKFIPALDEKAKPIEEVMTMYRDGDLKQPIRVTFIYGRAEGGDLYGWIARANVGDL